MSITYEEALETLESMFGAPWDRDSLDLVLRHFQGHMENTVESILGHGDKDPAILLEILKSGNTAANTAQDQDLARQLAIQDRQQQQQQQTGRAAAAAAAAVSSTKEPGRGTPTDLAPDFLRIPGHNGGGVVMDQDEALARMLQDELFSQELANNPEFAHLANSRGSAGQRRGIPKSSSMSRPPAVAGSEPKIMEHISDMGQDAKKRLQLFAAQWNTGVNKLASKFAGHNNNAAATQENAGAANETRGLLDSDDGEEMEMSFSKTKNQ